MVLRMLLLVLSLRLYKPYNTLFPLPPHAPAAGWRQELEIQSIKITDF